MGKGGYVERYVSVDGCGAVGRGEERNVQHRKSCGARRMPQQRQGGSSNSRQFEA